MSSDMLRHPSEIAAPKLIKKLADIYITKVVATAEADYSLTTRQVALWKSQHGEHTSDWLRAVPISVFGQTMNGRTYRSVKSYQLGIPMFPVSRSCSACSRVFHDDVFGDHAVSCSGTVGVKHRHNLVRDTLLDIYFQSRISAAKEVDVGLIDGHDKPFRPADLLLYSWDRGRDVYVDLTGSSPLTQSAMADYALRRVVIDAVRRKCAKYQDLCEERGYGFLPFSFSLLGELETGAVALLKRIQKISVSEDAGRRAAAHIFSRIGFVIVKGVGAQIVSRLPTKFL
ncbi:hypothetical protein OROMI_012462 [Orobanche minor]